MKRVFLVALAAFLVVASAGAQAKIKDNLGVAIQSCVVNQNGSGQTNGINVVYYNSHESAATEVDFLVRYHGERYILIDRGTFTRGAQINHNLTNSLIGMPWFGPTPNMCTPQRVFLENGKVEQI